MRRGIGAEEQRSVDLALRRRLSSATSGHFIAGSVCAEVFGCRPDRLWTRIRNSFAAVSYFLYSRVI